MNRAVATRDHNGSEISRPVVPRDIARLIADPYTLDGMAAPGAWRVPDVVPDRKRLEETLAALRQHMVPAAPEWIKSCLMRLAVMTHIEGHKELTPHQKQQYWKASAEEYIRLLGKYPADIWAAATDEAILQRPFFPKPAVLNALMQPKLARRAEAIWRIERMLTVPEPKRGEPKEELPVRLRCVVDLWKKQPEGSFIKGVLRKGAIDAERKLAALEGRAVETWALLEPQNLGDGTRDEEESEATGGKALCRHAAP